VCSSDLMALARARAFGGDDELCAEIETEVAAVLAQPRDAAKVKAEASEMRALIEKEKPPRDLWDIKLSRTEGRRCGSGGEARGGGGG